MCARASARPAASAARCDVRQRPPGAASTSGPVRAFVGMTVVICVADTIENATARRVPLVLANVSEVAALKFVPVIVSGVHRLPLRRSDDYDAAYTFPSRLHAAGFRFCISSAGRFGASNVRNLGNHAGMAVAFGLNHNEALKAITLYPAQILGVADRVGSLEAGKDATLIVTDGDPLETPTQVLRAFVQGREVDLGDRHKSLARKYEEKLRRQSKP